MNTKLLINIYIPYTDENFDIFIPVNKKVGTIKNTILSSIKGLGDKQLQLFSLDENTMIEENVYVKNSGIKNGSKLVLL